MSPDPHQDSPDEGSRPGPDQDPGRVSENQADAAEQFAAGRRFDTEKAGLPLAGALANAQAGLAALDDDGGSSAES